MKLFNIQVRSSDRNFDIRLRNLTIIRASQILHKIAIACLPRIRSLKRFLVPGKLGIDSLIKIRSFKSLKQKADIAVDVLPLISSRKRMTMDDTVQVSADSNISSMKRVREEATWRVITDALLGTQKRIGPIEFIGPSSKCKTHKENFTRLNEQSSLFL